MITPNGLAPGVALGGQLNIIIRDTCFLRGFIALSFPKQREPTISGCITT